MTSMQKKKLVYTLCTLALLTAMMVLLTMTVSIQTPFFKLSFGSLGKQPGLSGNFCLGRWRGPLWPFWVNFWSRSWGPTG